MIRIEADMPKERIAELAQQRGKVNTKSVTLLGEKHRAGSLVFVGFFGSHVGNHIFRGELLYDQAQGWEQSAEKFPIPPKEIARNGDTEPDKKS